MDNIGSKWFKRLFGRRDPEMLARSVELLRRLDINSHRPPDTLDSFITSLIVFQRTLSSRDNGDEKTQLTGSLDNFYDLAGNARVASHAESFVGIWIGHEVGVAFRAKVGTVTGRPAEIGLEPHEDGLNLTCVVQDSTVDYALSVPTLKGIRLSRPIKDSEPPAYHAIFDDTSGAAMIELNFGDEETVSFTFPPVASPSDSQHS